MNRKLTKQILTPGTLLLLPAFLFSCLGILFHSLACLSEARAANMGWTPTSGMTLTQIDNTDLKISGMQGTGSWHYAQMPLPFPKLESGATYRLEGWMKVGPLSARYYPAFRLDALDSSGKWITSYRTYPAVIDTKNTWQKLWGEFTIYDDRVNGGYIAVDKGSTNAPLKAELYIRGVSLTKIKNAISFPLDTYVSDVKLNDVFWSFKKSDVIAFTPSTLYKYRTYGVTFVSWGEYPQPDASSIKAYCKKINDALKAGTKIGAKIEIRTSFGSFINHHSDAEILEAQTKDLTGQPFIVPDATKVKVRGYPAYWFSINNPTFRDFLKGNAERAMQCKPYGLMVDDALGDAHTVLYRDGEYSNNGVTGFRNYLKSTFTSAQLLQNNISDIGTFDIKKYHQMYLGVPKESRPFRKDLIDFQLKAAADTFHEIKSKALAKLGQRVPVGGNIDPASKDAACLFMDVDYFSFECSMNAKSGNPNNGTSLFSYKMADALKRPAALMGGGGDHAFVQDNNLPGMIRCWIAEAYAFGNYFLAPYRLWAYSPAKGSYVYKPRSDAQLAPIFMFIKNHPYLFDDYSVVAPNALMISYITYSQNSTGITAMAKQLADQSIPFEIVIAGNDVLGLHLSASQLAQYDSLIVPDGSIFTIEDSAVLQSVKNGGKKTVSSVDGLDKYSQIGLKNATGIRATLRIVKTDKTKPAILHLLNGDYDVNIDSCRKKEGFVVTIPRKLLKDRIVTQVKYVRPPSWNSRVLSVTSEFTDTTLSFVSTVDFIKITVPSLDVWGILVLS